MDFSLLSIKLKVEFIDVKDRYPCDENLMCNYQLNSYVPQQGDRIAIFKMGWESLKDYILFDWAVESPSGNQRLTVTFKEQDLPKQAHDLDEHYQFCYISQENIIQGVSKPFQIYQGNTPLPDLTQNTKNISAIIKENKDREILRLREENAILKETLKTLIEQKKLTKIPDYNKDIQELKDLTEMLKSAVLNQQQEINNLKEQMQRDRSKFEQISKQKDIIEKKFEVLTREKTEEKGLVDEIVNFTLDDLPSLPRV